MWVQRRKRGEGKSLSNIRKVKGGKAGCTNPSVAALIKKIKNYSGM